MGDRTRPCVQKQKKKGGRKKKAVVDDNGVIAGVNGPLTEMWKSGDRFGIRSFFYCAQMKRKTINPPHLKD